MTFKMPYDACRMAGGFEGSAAKPTPPAIIFRLVALCFQRPILNLRVAQFGQYPVSRPVHARGSMLIKHLEDIVKGELE
jgi:hypothetical protein